MVLYVLSFQPCRRNNISHEPDQCFSFFAEQIEENKGMHVKEIQAFHKFFQVVYNPLNIEKTVKEVTLVLKQKVLNKVPKLTFPPYLNNDQNKYKIALEFHCIKFPVLPNADFILSFEPGSPSWFHFVIKQFKML